MSIIVVYKSLSGFTEKYAKWIAEDLHAAAIELDLFTPSLLNKDTVLIFGGSLHAIGINGYQKLKRTIREQKYKELVLFAVGASPHNLGIEDEIKRANFKTIEEQAIRLFYLRGGFDYSKLDLVNKLLMKLLKIKIKSKKESKRSSDEKGMLALYEKPMDATKRENIQGIVTYVTSIK